MSDLFNRRGALKSSLSVLGGGLLSRDSLEKAAAEQEPAVKNVNLNSSPSTYTISTSRWPQTRFSVPAKLIVASRAVIAKSITQLNDQAVAAFRMQALMKTEYVFGKPASGASARNDLAFEPV